MAHSASSMIHETYDIKNQSESVNQVCEKGGNHVNEEVNPCDYNKPPPQPEAILQLTRGKFWTSEHQSHLHISRPRSEQDNQGSSINAGCQILGHAWRLSDS